MICMECQMSQKINAIKSCMLLNHSVGATSRLHAAMSSVHVIRGQP